MWLNRDQYDEQVRELVRLEAIRTEQVRQVTSLQTTLDWLRVRVSQLEMERAQLLYNFMGVKVPTMEIAKAPAEKSTSSEVLNTLPSFDDVGDIEAAKQGIGWNELGEVTHSNRK